jgi:WD40 repeat protein/serine/threonine protein kinase/Tfp pilus assembly protein PilF
MHEEPTLPPRPPSADEGAGTRPSIPGYEVLAELGRGGMGVVYQALQVGLNRLVALKMILSGGHAGAHDLARFRAEAEAVARLQHPHIVQVYEVGEHDGLPYFSMEFVGGGCLADRLDGTPWPARPAAELVETLTLAMDHAHRQDVIHRDLKPANVLLASGGRQPPDGAQASGGLRPPLAGFVPKIADFGLAKRMDSAAGHTRTGAIMGTPSYMAPEQAGGKNKEVGPAADVYALGAILYECLTGRPPFRAETPLDTVLQVVSQEPVPPRRLQLKVPRDLETVCLKCLQKEPRKRYDSAGALADDLRRFLDGEPVQARPTPAWERLGKWARRRPAVAALSLLSLVVTVLGFGLVTWKWREAAAAHQHADLARHEAVEALEEVRTNLYFNDIALAEREWHGGNAHRAEELLETCPENLRGWEWRYLKRLGHTDLLTLTLYSPRSLAGYNAVAYSPDGKHLATGGPDNTVAVLDVARGEAAQTLRGHTSPVMSVAFRPSGGRLASGSSDGWKGELKAWDLKAGREVFTAPVRNGGAASVAFSPDGKWLATAGGQVLADRPADVTVWDATTGRPARTLRGPVGLVNSLAFSPDGRTLAAAGVNFRDAFGEVKVWEAASGKGLPPFRGHTRGLLGLAFSPDGTRLATASLDQTAKVWDVASRRDLLTYHGHGGAVAAVRFSPDGRLVASAGFDHTIQVWDAASGRRELTLRGHTGVPAGLDYGPDGRQVASTARSLPSLLSSAAGYSGGLQSELKIWDLTVGQEGPARPAHTGAMLRVAFSPDGKLVASAGFDGLVRVWDADTLQEVRTLRGRPGEANSVAFSPDGTRIAARRWEGPLTLWDLATGKEVLTLGGPAGQLHSAAFSPDGRLLVAETGGIPFFPGLGDVKVWDLATRREAVILRGRGGAFSPDGKWLAFGSGSAVKVWDLAGGREALSLNGHTADVVTVRFSADGRQLASGSYDGTTRVWDAATGREVATLRGHSGAVWSVAFHPDGRRLASASLGLAQGGKGETVLWDLVTGKPALTLAGNGSVDFSPDGTRLAGADVDPYLTSEVKVWDTREPTAEAKAARRTPPPAAVAAWHEQQANDCAAAEQWAGAVFHLDRALEAGPGRADLYEKRGNAHAALGHWRPASEDYARAVEGGPPDGLVWFKRALTLLALGDREGYRRHCARLLERYGKTDDPWVAIWVAWNCKLTPDALADFTPAVRLAEKAVAAAPKDDFRLNNLGGVLYRAGRYRDAVERLTQSMKVRDDGNFVWEWLWLAMAEQRLGHGEEARKWLKQAGDWIDEATREAARPGAGDRLPWYQRLEMQMLRHEAEALLGGAAPGTGK